MDHDLESGLLRLLSGCERETGIGIRGKRKGFSGPVLGDLVQKSTGPA